VTVDWTVFGGPNLYIMWKIQGCLLLGWTQGDGQIEFVCFFPCLRTCDFSECRYSWGNEYQGI